MCNIQKFIKWSARCMRYQDDIIKNITLRAKSSTSDNLSKILKLKHFENLKNLDYTIILSWFTWFVIHFVHFCHNGDTQINSSWNNVKIVTNNILLNFLVKPPELKSLWSYACAVKLLSHFFREIFQYFFVFNYEEWTLKWVHVLL